jgi:hypothetical protein
VTAKLGHIEHLATRRDVGQQYVHEGVLAVERRTALIFRGNDPPDCCEVAFAQGVVLRAIETFAPFKVLSGINPIIHDTSADEGCDLLGSIPSVKQQSVAIVRAVIDCEMRKRHGVFLQEVCFAARANYIRASTRAAIISTRRAGTTIGGTNHVVSAVLSAALADGA